MSTMKDHSRIFSNEELLQAGKLTITLIRESVEQGDTSEALFFTKRFSQELMTMLYSYLGWESAILEFIESAEGTAARQQALQAIEDWDIAPERLVSKNGVGEAWKKTLECAIGRIRDDNTKEALQDLDQLFAQARVWHDGMMSRVTALMSILYRRHGDKNLLEVLSRVMNPEAMGGDREQSYREKVESIMMFAQCHLRPFRVIEDEEKVTFMPDPCPSGGRLIQEGHYQAPRSNALVNDVGPLTYGRPDLPVYCCHEPAMELASVIKTGIPVFIVDTPEDIGVTPCRIHIYKRPEDIPDAYYRRLGVPKPEDLIAKSG